MFSARACGTDAEALRRSLGFPLRLDLAMAFLAKHRSAATSAATTGTKSEASWGGVSREPRTVYNTGRSAASRVEAALAEALRRGRAVPPGMHRPEPSPGLLQGPRPGLDPGSTLPGPGPGLMPEASSGKAGRGAVAERGRVRVAFTGDAASGHAASGHAASGHAASGHAASGHAASGHAASGHAASDGARAGLLVEASASERAARSSLRNGSSIRSGGGARPSRSVGFSPAGSPGGSPAGPGPPVRQLARRTCRSPSSPERSGPAFPVAATAAAATEATTEASTATATKGSGMSATPVASPGARGVYNHRPLSGAGRLTAGIAAPTAAPAVAARTLGLGPAGLGSHRRDKKRGEKRDEKRLRFGAEVGEGQPGQQGPALEPRARVSFA